MAVELHSASLILVLWSLLLLLVVFRSLVHISGFLEACRLPVSSS